MTQISVAKIDQAFAVSNGLTFTDFNGNYCVSLSFARYLQVTEFTPIPTDPNTNYSAMPVNPTKPIVR
jgi:hypothetical protein